MPLQATSGAASYDAFGGGVPVVPNYIEDVFSTYLYDGNSSTQTITNGIDLSGKGGLVWLKGRNTAGTEHELTDTARGTAAGGRALNSNDAQPNQLGDLTSFTSSGFGLSYNTANGNATGTNYASWTFRKQPKFFDVVTWTGNGTANRQISHSLGSTPGFIVFKCTNTTGDWYTIARITDTSYSFGLKLNATNAQLVATNPSSTISTTWFVPEYFNGSISDSNASGNTYVAYIFAHNAGGFGLTGTDNVISCGSYVGSGVASPPKVVTLGYEPQWIMIKSTTNAYDWVITDTMRGMSQTSGTYLVPNTAAAEVVQNPTVTPTATGFELNNSHPYFNSNDTYIYIAIRRGPMKVPTVGTNVFSPFNTSVTSKPLSFTSNFPVDFALTTASNKVSEKLATSRLQGGAFLDTTSTAAENVSTFFTFDSNTKISSTYWNTGFGSVQSMLAFQRAPSFFDEVCFGSSVTTAVPHNLAVVPELIIAKDRTGAGAWYVWQPSTSVRYGTLNTTTAFSAPAGSWPATSTTFEPLIYGSNIVNYLFATCPGVSKVGSYTGTGATQTINCGFGASGSRFVLIKRTDSTGDWYVWDSARGMVSGTDPSLLLNSTAAEVNANSVYAVSTGFQIVSTAAGINASGGSYIFLSVA